MSTTPESAMPSDHPSDRPAPPGDPGADAPPAPAPGTAFDAFLQAGRRPRARSVPASAASGMHADPDPEAIIQLPTAGGPPRGSWLGVAAVRSP